VIIRILRDVAVSGAITDAQRRLFIEAMGDADLTHRRRALFFQIYAELAAFVGDLEVASEAVTRAADAGLIDLFWLDACPLFAPLRGTAGFEAARARVAVRAEETLRAFEQTPSQSVIGPLR
jgi:hypothetical protein